jgi:hypothetical protein
VTFEELEDRLPNGFHDAEIRNINVDFVNRSLVIGMNLHVSEFEEADSERYRAGTLKVESPFLFFIDPPDAKYHFVPDGSPLNATGNSVKVGMNASLDRLLPALPLNSTIYLFFLDDWNSSIYLAGAGVKFSWDDGETIT